MPSTFGPILGVGTSVPVGGGSGRSLVVGPSESPSGYTSIDAALADAQEGDTIFIQPGTYTSTVTITKNYITLIGGQVGRYGWPDIVPTTGSALFVNNAQGFVAKNIRFSSNDSDVVKMEGNGFIFENCVFDSGTGLAATEGLVLLKGDATNDDFTASEGLFKNCLFRRGGALGKGIIFTGAEALVGVGSSDCAIVGCLFQTAIDGTPGIDLITADNSTVNALYSVKNLLVKDCVFADKNKTNYIDFTTANGGAASDQTGCIADSFFATDAITTTNIAIVGTGFTVVGCYDTVGVQDGSGLD